MITYLVTGKVNFPRSDCVVCENVICCKVKYFSYPTRVIFNRPYNIVTSSIFKFIGLLTLVCSTCINLCFDWTLHLTKFANTVLEGIFTKGKKTNDHQHLGTIIYIYIYIYNYAELMYIHIYITDIYTYIWGGYRVRQIRQLTYFSFNRHNDMRL